MKIGMNLLLWTAAVEDRHLPLIEEIKGWGFDGIEVPMFALDASPWKTYAKKFDAMGLGRTVVAVLPAGTSLIDEEAGARKAAVTHLKGCVDACGELGAEALAGPLHHPVGALAGRGPTEDEHKRCVESLRMVGEHAAKSGLTISLEPLNRFETYFINSAEQAARVTRDVGLINVGILYDTFHANIEEKDVAGAIRGAKDQINHVHISANDRATPGEDHVHWKTTFDALKSIGYDGWLTIEAFGLWLPELAGATCIWRRMAPSEEHIAREGVKFVRKMLG